MLRAAIEGISPGLQPLMRTHVELSLTRNREVVGAELATALDMPRGSVDRQLSRARHATRDGIVALVLARTGRSNCPELGQKLDGILSTDQQQASRSLVLDPTQCKTIFTHTTGCETCGPRASEARDYSRWALGPGLLWLDRDDEERRRAAATLFEHISAAAPLHPHPPPGHPPSHRPSRQSDPDPDLMQRPV